MKIYLLKSFTYNTAPKSYLLHDLLFVVTSTPPEKETTDSKTSNN